MDKRTLKYRVLEITPIDYDITLEDIGNFCVKKHTQGGVSYLRMHTSGGFSRWIEITRHLTNTTIKMGVKALDDKKITTMVENFLGGTTIGVEILTNEEFEEEWTGIKNSYFGNTDLTEFGIYI